MMWFDAMMDADKAMENRSSNAKVLGRTCFRIDLTAIMLLVSSLGIGMGFPGIWRVFSFLFYTRAIFEILHWGVYEANLVFRFVPWVR